MQISVRPIKKTNRVVFSSTSSDNDTLHPHGDGGDMGSDEEGMPMKTVPPPEVETLVESWCLGKRGTTVWDVFFNTLTPKHKYFSRLS